MKMTGTQRLLIYSYPVNEM